MLHSLQKRCFSTVTGFYLLLVNDVVSASSHANRDNYTNCNIFVLRALMYVASYELFEIELVLCDLYLRGHEV